MATIVLKDVPAGLLERLELRARATGRSVGEEAIVCLESVIEAEAPRPTAEEVRQIIEKARVFREKLAATGFSITDEEITAWKRQGRP